MNKVNLTGRLSREPELRYSQSAEPIAITRFTVAVPRKFKKDDEPNADFINCVAFGKTAEFIGKYFNKGKMIGIVGSLKSNSWTDNNGQKRISTEVQVEEAEFLEKKESNTSTTINDENTKENFIDSEKMIDDEDKLPFE